MSKMKEYPNLLQIIEDTQHRLGELTKSLKGWNLIGGLFSEARTSEEDIAHALAVEGRELVKNSLRLTFALGEAAMPGMPSAWRDWYTYSTSWTAAKADWQACARMPSDRPKERRPANEQAHVCTGLRDLL